MYKTYGDRAEFLFVYIREAHPEDEWQLPQNESEKVVFAQPKTFSDRLNVAKTCSSALKLTMPCLVDEIDNPVDEAYAAWPERLFVVAKDGRIAYAGGQGPFGFKPNEVESWLQENTSATP